MKTSYFIKSLFTRDYTRYDGVCPINVYLLRLVFALTFLFVGMSSWTTLINHQGEWVPTNAVAWSVWAAYSSLAVFGIWKPLKMLPVMAFQILYKLIWLSVVAYPLWIDGSLMGSPAENMTKDFLWVVLPIVAMPWGYFFKSFFSYRTRANAVAG